MDLITRTAGMNGITTWKKPTNFYPLYDGKNDQVDRVSSVRPVAFQIIIPRYRLSTSDTRDLGTGPGLEEIPYRAADPNEMRRYSGRAVFDKQKGRLPFYAGTRIDLLA